MKRASSLRGPVQNSPPVKEARAKTGGGKTKVSQQLTKEISSAMNKMSNVMKVAF